MFTREEVWALMAKVDKEATEVKNTAWKRMYIRLSDALNELDAYIARSAEDSLSVKVIKPRDNTTDKPKTDASNTNNSTVRMR